MLFSKGLYPRKVYIGLEPCGHVRAQCCIYHMKLVLLLVLMAIKWSASAIKALQLRWKACFIYLWASPCWEIQHWTFHPFFEPRIDATFTSLLSPSTLSDMCLRDTRCHIDEKHCCGNYSGSWIKWIDYISFFLIPPCFIHSPLTLCCHSHCGHVALRDVLEMRATLWSSLQTHLPVRMMAICLSCRVQNASWFLSV